MTESNTLNILKKAIILEQRGHAFYKKVAEQAENKEVKYFFESMAQEEILHLKVLSAQFKAFNKGGTFDPGTFEAAQSSALPQKVLNPETMKQIASAGFEASAISAAIAMEQRAVNIYADQADATNDPEEKKLYNWLSTWEREHLNMLMEMDQALMDQVWGDNNFWPM
ncbi:Rubrerythrin [Desulfocicer vacuolatum DSM 3385]|uniref:Rubrerythrin n=1 Tax=Desulfocicer vacuolatum DSM 3385 TaxID=1121400 RepID=A0A1W2CQ47_9BACT|nr:ferritin family protein [Desulfocicer vacuolatum]SMC87333.1 Rubrerythrin [Desulfocicer vacuolatum DSM 3385]